MNTSCIKLDGKVNSSFNLLGHKQYLCIAHCQVSDDKILSEMPDKFGTS
jgi:hypothetical protein